MEQENALAQDIQCSKDAQYDAACKRLLAYKQFLARIMQRCVVEFKDCTIDDIVNKYIEGEPLVAQIGVHPNTSIINVEAQNDTSTGYPLTKRGLY